MTKPTKKKDAVEELRHKQQWINIAVLVMFISGMIVSGGLGMRIGKRQGEEAAIAFTVKQMQERLDGPCFDKLAATFERK